MSAMDSQTVYVVDDDEPTRRSVDSILRSVGYSVQLFNSGHELLKHAERGISGCIVLDVRLPGPSGLEIQRRLADAGLATPVIFITGHGDIAMAVQAMKANAVEFLTKPFRDQDLLDAISTAMERDRQQRLQNEQAVLAENLVRSLSPREFAIFSLLRQGLLGKQIAHELHLSEATVKVHRRNIMQKLGVTTVSQLILLFGHLGDVLTARRTASD